MWGFLKKAESQVPLYKTDMHSHLLPGIDDGVKTLEEAEVVIQLFSQLGFTKAITTPHIMNDYYRNTPQIIRTKRDELNAHLKSKNILFEVSCAAEYYFDETLLDLLSSDAELLTFAGQYLLFETNTFAEPMMLDDFIFKLKLKNYTPVLAHPERYQYLQNNFSRIENLLERGVLFQVNALSLTGYYSKPIQKLANFLVEKKMVHFLGSDCHTVQHAKLLGEAVRNKHFKRALELPLLNYSI